VQHARRGEHNHRPGLVNEGAVECFYVLEVEHVPLNKCLFDFLASPCDEQLVVVVGLLSQSEREINGVCQLHSLPVGLQKNAKLLSPAQSEHRNEDFATFVQAGVHLLNEIPFSATLRISDCSCVC